MVLANPSRVSGRGVVSGRALGLWVVCWHMCRVGQNHIYGVYTVFSAEGNQQLYGHIRCMYAHGSGRPYT